MGTTSRRRRCRSMSEPLCTIALRRFGSITKFLISYIASERKAWRCDGVLERLVLPRMGHGSRAAFIHQPLSYSVMSFPALASTPNASDTGVTEISCVHKGRVVITWASRDYFSIWLASAFQLWCWWARSEGLEIPRAGRIQGVDGDHGLWAGFCADIGGFPTLAARTG